MFCCCTLQWKAADTACTGVADHWPGNLCAFNTACCSSLASLSSSSFYCLQNGSFCGFILDWILEKQVKMCLSVLSYFCRNRYKKTKYNLEVMDFNRSELSQPSWLNLFSQPILGKTWMFFWSLDKGSQSVWVHQFLTLTEIPPHDSVYSCFSLQPYVLPLRTLHKGCWNQSSCNFSKSTGNPTLTESCFILA